MTALFGMIGDLIAAITTMLQKIVWLLANQVEDLLDTQAINLVAAIAGLMDAIIGILDEIALLVGGIDTILQGVTTAVAAMGNAACLVPTIDTLLGEICRLIGLL